MIVADRKSLAKSVLHDVRQAKAERAGFEPAVRFDPHTAFPVPHLRQLGHLSGITKGQYGLGKFYYRRSQRTTRDDDGRHRRLACWQDQRVKDCCKLL